MPFSDASSSLEPLLFQMKQYKNLTKSTIEILPSSGQQVYLGGSKVQFTLPYASVMSLEDIAFIFEFQGVNNKTDVSIMPPLDIASLIAEIDIKVNGSTVQNLTRYSDIVNLLNLFKNNKTKNNVLQNCNPGMKKWNNTGTISTQQNNDYNVLANGKKQYIINNWHGLLGKRGEEVSSNFIDTNMLGEVVISFTLHKANVCFNSSVKGGGTMGTTTNDNYQLSDCKLSIVRYNLPDGYSDGIKNNLKSGTKYQIAFDHYNFVSTSASTSTASIRFNENSRDIKALWAFFTDTTRDNTSVATDFNTKTQTSHYFDYQNLLHASSQFQIGSVLMPQNKMNTTEIFLENMRVVSGLRNGNIELHPHILTVEDFQEMAFVSILSLEMTEGMTLQSNDGKKLLSGLSSEQLPISCVYTYTNNAGSFNNKQLNVMVISTRLLVIESGQQTYVEI